jgi:hypothetical protein
MDGISVALNFVNNLLEGGLSAKTDEFGLQLQGVAFDTLVYPHLELDLVFVVLDLIDHVGQLFVLQKAFVFLFVQVVPHSFEAAI